MEKLLKDRINHLQSELAQNKNQKMDKGDRTEIIAELVIRIDENKVLLNKLK